MALSFCIRSTFETETEKNVFVTNPDIKVVEYDYFIGMFEDKYPLCRAIFPDGVIIEEFVQAEVWSSGPCFFIALRKNGEEIKESLWEQKDIDNECLFIFKCVAL